MKKKTELCQVAPAKLNLALHVRARRADGYHNLETLFGFIGHGDHITVHDADTLSLTIAGRFADGLAVDEDNLVLRAAHLLASQARRKPEAVISLEKNLPIASGIGGGSADAAATLRLLNRLWGLDWPLERLARLGSELGADVPACVYSRYSDATGVGDVMTFPPPILPDHTPILLVNPLESVSTADVFKAWDQQDHGVLPKVNTLVDLRDMTRNDLTASAMLHCAGIEDILQALNATNPLLARMSGSGATCFAVYSDKAARDRAAEDIEARYPDYWLCASHSMDHDFGL